MRRPSMNVMLAVFFCSSGWVYSSQVFGADEATAVTPVAEKAAETPATQPAAAGTPGLFDGGTQASAPAKGQAKRPEKLPEGQSVAVGSFGQVDLHVKDADLTQVLQLLSIQAQRNIVATKSVNGSISADLYGVDFYEALDAILHPNGFGYREKGNFVYVYTLQEINAMKEAERKVEHRLIRLNYINAQDAASFIEPLKSSVGSITLSGQAPAGFQPSISDGGADSFAHSATLVLRDYAENIEAMLGVIKELDIRPKQLMVDVSVLQARLTEQNEFGVDLSVLVDYSVADFTGVPVSLIDSLLNGKVSGSSSGGSTSSVVSSIGHGGGLQTGVGNTGKAGGVKLGILSDQISAFVRVLDEVTDTTVLAHPKILVLNRQKADLLVGGRLGYISTTASETSTTQTVQFLDVGTQLTVRPFISDDGFIRMELKPRISDGETRQVGNFVIPNETTQELTTNVIVRNGQTLVLGGLFKEDTTVSRRQVPGLGDVPVLGAAFKGHDDDVTRTEVIFLLTPTIVKDEAMYAAGERAKDSLELAKLGAREGLLPWSRSKLTASHLRDANEQLKAGNKDKALWCADMALTLEPTNVDAIRLKEQITGQRTWWPDRSMMKDAVDTMIKKQMGDAAPAVEKPASASAEAAPKAQPDAKVSQPNQQESTAAVETETGGH